MELYMTEARELDTFIAENLQPSEDFLGLVRQAINIICEFLRENCFKDSAPPRPRVLKVIKGGSIGKGTSLKGDLGASLVVFLSIFKDYTDQDEKRTKIIQEIRKRLEEFQEENGEYLDVTLEASENPHVLKFKLRFSDLKDSIEFDVFAAFNALGQYKKGSKPDPQVYVDLINSSSSHQGGEFSTCFVELQREFIIARPSKLKGLIHLLKHWYKEYVCPYKTQLQKGESLPPKYALELLAVYAYEQGSQGPDFDMAEGFRTVLMLLQQYRQLCIFWTTFYDFENKILKLYLLNQLQKPRPVILDPADPTWIVGEGSRWDLLAQEAECCSHQKCCLPHWDVPVRSQCTELAMDAAMDLYGTPPRQLDKFIADRLQPNETFLRQVGLAIDFVCDFLRNNCFKYVSLTRVLKVVKGGSSGKGTALKGGSDADLVVFLDIFKTYKDQEIKRKEIIEEIHERLEEFKNKTQKNVIFEQITWSNPRVLSFTLSSNEHEDSIEFDVLPAFDALGQRKGTKPPAQVYIDLIKSSRRGGEYSPCFTELQRDFIIKRPPKLKNLIRLLKHWYKEYVRPYKTQLQKGESLPPKYALELLAVYAYEQGNQEPNFVMAEGFQTVLMLLQQYRQLCIFWTTFYDLENETLKLYLLRQLQKPRPVILDPADPTGIVGQGSRWDILAQEAEYCSRQRCCLPHWDVPLQVPWKKEVSYYISRDERKRGAMEGKSNLPQPPLWN